MGLGDAIRNSNRFDKPCLKEVNMINKAYSVKQSRTIKRLQVKCFIPLRKICCMPLIITQNKLTPFASAEFNPSFSFLCVPK